MVADGGDDGGRLLGTCAHLVEDTESHNRAGLRVVDAVDDVSDVVQPARDRSQFAGAVVIAQRLQNGAGLRRDKPHMGEAVLRKAQRGQRFVRLADIACDLFAFLDLFERDRHRRSFSLQICQRCAGQPVQQLLGRGGLPDGQKFCPPGNHLRVIVAFCPSDAL